MTDRRTDGPTDGPDQPTDLCPISTIGGDSSPYRASATACTSLEREREREEWELRRVGLNISYKNLLD